MNRRLTERELLDRGLGVAIKEQSGSAVIVYKRENGWSHQLDAQARKRGRT